MPPSNAETSAIRPLGLNKLNASLKTPMLATSASPLYLRIALLLSLVTLLEFLLILPEGLRGTGLVVGPLVALPLAKFAIVALFYMHLRHDHKLLNGIFLVGLILSFAVGVSLVGLFGAFSPYSGSTPFASGPLPPPYPGLEPDPTPGPTPTPRPVVDVDKAETGRQIFLTGEGQGSGTACLTCHTIEGVPGAAGILGPDLTHIGTDAANRQPGVSAREYLKQSIEEPEVFVAEGVERAVPGLMLADLTAGLTGDDVEALVEFLLSQE